MQGHYYESLHDQERIGIEDGMLRLRKTSGTYKDFGKLFYEVWLENFLDYTSIMVSLFTPSMAELNIALNSFYDNIFQLSQVYEWQKTVFPLAIKVHTHIISLQPSDPTKWDIPPAFQGRFCNPLTLFGSLSVSSSLSHNKRKRSHSSPSRRVAKPPGGPINNLIVICEAFNKGLYGWANCERIYKCKGCGAKEHGLVNCPKRRAGKA